MARSILSPLENPITTRKRFWDWLARPEIRYFRLRQPAIGEVTLSWGVQESELPYDKPNGRPGGVLSRGNVTHYQVTGETFQTAASRMLVRENSEDPESLSEDSENLLDRD